MEYIQGGFRPGGVKVVLDYVQLSADTVLTTKSISVFPDQQPWLESTVWSLLKARDAASRSGDKPALSRTRRELKKGIQLAKLLYRRCIKKRSVQRGIRTDYKWSEVHHDTNLPDTLNSFLALFETPSGGETAHLLQVE